MREQVDAFLCLFFLFFFQNLWFNTLTMMNDMMPTIEETASAADLAQIEHEEWERGNEERERWGSTEAVHGPLLTKADLDAFHADMMRESLALDLALENAFKCDDNDEWFDDGPLK